MKIVSLKKIMTSSDFTEWTESDKQILPEKWPHSTDHELILTSTFPCWCISPSWPYQKKLCKLLLLTNILKRLWVWNIVNCLTSKVFPLILQFHSGLLTLSLPDPRVNTTSLELIGVHWLPDLYLSNSSYL